MFKLAADHNVDGDILRGMRRRVPDVDLVRAVDATPRLTTTWSAHRSEFASSPLA